MSVPLHVLCVPRSDALHESDVMLVYVQRRGPGLLDLDLFGTEGANPYSTSVKHDSVDKLQAKSFRGSREEWFSIVSWTFLRSTPEAKHLPLARGIELVASVHDEREVSLTFRQNVSGITQRLGALILARNDDHEIELFDWTSLAARNVNKHETKIDQLQKELQVRDDLIALLRAQMEDFLKLKKEHEDQTLERFANLLNTKKMKIRDQQRLLSGSRIDESTAMLTRSVRSGKGTTKGIAPKRKARDAIQQEPDTGSNSDSETITQSVNKSREAASRATDSPYKTDEEGTPSEGESEEIQNEIVANNIEGGETPQATKHLVLQAPQPRQLPFDLKRSSLTPAPVEEDTDEEEL